MSSPQEKVWGSRDLREYILKKLRNEINKYYVNICKHYERLFFKK